MHILIEECVEERFRDAVTGHDWQAARYAGLEGLKAENVAALPVVQE
ncbi:MAG TPA: hypothetical protein VKP58_11700 [Candidatus Acidoferrum sp.]|nr:hypothetical protein [Candidatus Acidoferrum sp.]